MKDEEKDLNNAEANLATLAAWFTAHKNPPVQNLGLRALYFVSRLEPQLFGRLLHNAIVLGKGIGDLCLSDSPLREVFQIPLSEVPQIPLPTWARCRVFDGFSGPKMMDLITLHQTSTERCYNRRDDGEWNDYVLGMFRRFVRGIDDPSEVSQPIRVSCDDPINNCLHLGVVAWMLRNKYYLPPLLFKFLDRRGKIMWSWPDAVFGDDGEIHIPFHRFGDSGTLDQIDWSLTVCKPDPVYRSTNIVTLVSMVSDDEFGCM